MNESCSTEVESNLLPCSFAWGSDAVAPNVPVGSRMGNQDNPELHTYDGEYRGSPEKGDKLIPE